jgi:amino acid adenylation domain-containing protein
MPTLVTCSQLPSEQEAIRAKCFHPRGTFVAFPNGDVERSIPDRFEEMARLYPDRVAVGRANQVLTYAELNTMANRLARAIVAERGSGAEAIGILFEKSAPMMAAMLGVLKAGKFFVLLDPSFPKERLAVLLDDALAATMVTDRQNASLARQVVTNVRPLIQFESIDRSIPAEDLGIEISPEALAFIIYTSGSTGQPKGVVWIHRQLLHQAMLYTNTYHLCRDDRISLLAAGTGNAITNTFYALLNGAALLPFDVRKQGVNQLAGWLVGERISFCLIGSPLFRSLCETLRGSESFSDLRLIRLASESVYKTDVELYQKHFAGSCLLANALSSSETGLSTTFFVDHEMKLVQDEVPVGYAVGGKEILLLDDSGGVAGVNEGGEIVVRSRYLSPGYWRRPDLTKAKFKPDPEGGEKRVYLTGDLGLMLSDGCLIHKGRKDFRVKIRGYGVETAEVEKVLQAHPAVKEAIVLSRRSESGETLLVAYITAAIRPAPSVSELRAFLEEKLANYMIPAAFVKLREMPLTPSGKVDRNCLPDPGRSRPEMKFPGVSPRTPVEKHLAEIWAEILALDEVGIHDDFFALGGHSLAATRVVSLILKTFQLEIPLQSLFQSPTVAAMAVVIMNHQGKKLEEKELNRLLTELESLSEEEALRLWLDEKRDLRMKRLR